LGESLLWFIDNRFYREVVMSKKSTNKASVMPNFDVTFILFSFKLLVLLILITAVFVRIHSISQIQGQLSEIPWNQLQKQISTQTYNENKCGDKNPGDKGYAACSSLWNDIQNEQDNIWKGQGASEKFYNNPWYLLFYLPGIIAAWLLILGRFVRPSVFVAMSSFVFLTPDFGGYSSILILVAFIAMFGHGYRLLMVPEEDHKAQASD
jgi:hypothetical protein